MDVYLLLMGCSACIPSNLLEIWSVSARIDGAASGYTCPDKPGYYLGYTSSLASTTSSTFRDFRPGFLCGGCIFCSEELNGAGNGTYFASIDGSYSLVVTQYGNIVALYNSNGRVESSWSETGVPACFDPPYPDSCGCSNTPGCCEPRISKASANGAFSCESTIGCNIFGEEFADIDCKNEGDIVLPILTIGCDSSSNSYQDSEPSRCGTNKRGQCMDRFNGKSSSTLSKSITQQDIGALLQQGVQIKVGLLAENKPYNCRKDVCCSGYIYDEETDSYKCLSDHQSCWTYYPYLNVPDPSYSKVMARFKIATKKSIMKNYKSIGGTVYFYYNLSGKYKSPCCLQKDCKSNDLVECFTEKDEGVIVAMTNFRIDKSSEKFKRIYTNDGAPSEDPDNDYLYLAQDLTTIGTDTIPDLGSGKEIKSCFTIDKVDYN